MRNLVIDAERLWGDIMSTSAIGATAKGGICRLTLTDLDRQVRDWFKAQCEGLGLTVTVDDMGVMFARRPGQRNDLAPIGLGSHLDTQPTGGKFDGVLGVISALEAVRTMVQAGYETVAPIEIINWTNEEGARFAPSMTASGVFGGAFKKDWALSRTDPQGVTYGEALEAIGYRGSEPCGEHPLTAFFELHIEQGPLLEAESKEIGIVTGVQGLRWYEVTVTGQDAHTGATPMHLRKNALLGAARLIERINDIANAHAPLAVGTVGMMEVKPNSRNVVPGEVFLTVDLRHPESDVIEAMEKLLVASLSEICDPLGLGVTMACIADTPPVRFNADCIESVRAAAALSGLSAREIISGAGHDATYVSRVAPTSMIFVPCKGGVSHNEAEFSSKEQCAAGAQVLLQAVLDYDRKLAEKGVS
ncbi:MAG: Zn-dependent hydrolase [Variibacter sp.]